MPRNSFSSESPYPFLWTLPLGEMNREPILITLLRTRKHLLSDPPEKSPRSESLPSEAALKRHHRFQRDVPWIFTIISAHFPKNIPPVTKKRILFRHFFILYLDNSSNNPCMYIISFSWIEYNTSKDLYKNSVLQLNLAFNIICNNISQDTIILIRIFNIINT